MKPIGHYSKTKDTADRIVLFCDMMPQLQCILDSARNNFYRMLKRLYSEQTGKQFCKQGKWATPDPEFNAKYGLLN